MKPSPVQSDETTSVGVLINEFETIAPGQTTVAMLRELARRRIDTWVFGVGDLELDARGRVLARARRVTAGRPERVVVALRAAKPEPIIVDELAAVVVRTNPPRDRREGLHTLALQLLRFARERGVLVLNDPDGLALAASKLFLGMLPPETRPRTIACADAETLRQFVRDAPGPTVLKPALGTQGRGVYRVSASDPNLNQIIESLVERGSVIAQDFVPAATRGDTRVILVDGELLRVGSSAAAVQRVPQGADFRSNVHVGGVPQLGVITPGVERVTAAVGPLLARHGLFMVGLDLIGDVVCELNVFSPGGLPDLERFTGKPFTRVLVDRLLAKIPCGEQLRAAV
ncbi:MAG: hypothetical protein H6713_08365 [Myxococcales bacterium]|nr:hypothetical protein [Myxococcales bacterium]MCB9750001.1 hypothetical protein [Myxococcales bacterium]